MQSYYKKNKKNLYLVLPLSLLVFLVPLIVHLKIIDLDGLSFLYWNGKKSRTDFFSYYKMIWLLILTSLSLVMFLAKLYQNNNFKFVKKINIYIPLLVYIVLLILSTLTSNYKDIALKGFVDRYEGMYVLMAYGIILFTAINLADTKEQFKLILGSLIISSIIIALIGILQYFNIEFFKSDFAKQLIISTADEKRVGSMTFTLGEHAVFSTLYHYNYVGSYVAMLFPLSLVLFIQTKDKIIKIIMGLASILMFVFLIVCRSRAGLVGTVIALFFIIMLLRKQIIKHWKFTASFIVILILLFFSANAFTNNSITKRIGTLLQDAVSVKKESVSAISKEDLVKNVTIYKNKIKIEGSKEVMNIEYKNDTICFKDENENNMEVNKENGKITFKDNAYKDYSFNIIQLVDRNNQMLLSMHKQNMNINFALSNNGFKYMYPSGLLVEPQPVKSWGFEGKEKLGSARGYIWSRTLPLLKNAFVLGYGPDTFAIIFPQYDYLGKYKGYGTTAMLVDKVHSFYLQTAINSGVVSLIALLIVFILYIVNTIKIYFKSDLNNFYASIGLACFAAVVGYLGAGFFNDSVVSVAPVFWTLLGLGICANYKYITSKQED